MSPGEVSLLMFGVFAALNYTQGEDLMATTTVGPTAVGGTTAIGPSPYGLSTSLIRSFTLGRSDPR